MRMRLLGNSGHEVSTMALGTMTWGRDTDEPEARSQYKAFIEAGGNFLDTADSYSQGVSEELVGQIIAETVSYTHLTLPTILRV